MTRLLLDTHALYWALIETQYLSSEAATAIQNPDNQVFATLFSAQDLGVKLSSGRWPNALPLLENFERDVEAAGFGLIYPHADDYSNLLHIQGQGDPVDRLIYVQAVATDMTLVTSDGQAGMYLPPGYPTINAGRSPLAREKRQQISPSGSFRKRPV